MAFQRLLCCWHGGLFVWNFFLGILHRKALALLEIDGF
jgi:hypothetical protein